MEGTTVGATTATFELFFLVHWVRWVFLSHWSSSSSFFHFPFTLGLVWSSSFFLSFSHWVSGFGCIFFSIPFHWVSGFWVLKPIKKKSTIGATNWLLWVCEFSRCFKDANEFSGFVLQAQNRSGCYGYWGLKEKKKKEKRKEKGMPGFGRSSQIRVAPSHKWCHCWWWWRSSQVRSFFLLFFIFFLFAFLILDP